MRGGAGGKQAFESASQKRHDSSSSVCFSTSVPSNCADTDQAMRWCPFSSSLVSARGYTCENDH